MMAKKPKQPAMPMPSGDLSTASVSSWVATRQPPKFVRRRWSLGQAGITHLVVCGLIFAAGVKTQANLLFWGFGLMIGAMVVSAIWAWISLRRLELLRLLPDHAVAGQALTLRYRVVSRQKWIPLFNLVIQEISPKPPAVFVPRLKRLRWQFWKRPVNRQPFSGVIGQSPLGWIVHLGPKQTVQAQATGWPLKRGRLVLGPMRLSSSFPFGIVRCTMEFDQPDYVLVYPELHRMNRNVWHRLTTLDPAGHLQVDRAGGAEEFFGLRRYRLGDSLRSIDWRHSAKTGQLISRELTQPSPPRVMILLDLTPPPPLNSASRPPLNSPLTPLPPLHSPRSDFPNAPEPFAQSSSGGSSSFSAGSSSDASGAGKEGGQEEALPAVNWLLWRYSQGWPRRRLWFRVMTGLASEAEYRIWAEVKSHGRSASPRFTQAQLQERAVALTASLVCGAHLQGYQVGLAVVGGTAVMIRPHHSLPHRSRLLEALALLEAEVALAESVRDGKARGGDRGGMRGGRGVEPTLVVTASPQASRASVGKAMHLSADRMEDYVKPTQDHWQLLARSVQPASRHRRLASMVSDPSPVVQPTIGEGGAG